MNPVEAVVRSFAQMHPEETARILEGSGDDKAVRLLRKLPDRDVGAVMEKLSPHAIEAVVARLSPEYLSRILDTLETRRAVRLLQYLQEAAREAALGGMPEARSRQLRELLQYPSETAAGMMNTQVTTLPIDVTVREAIQILRKARPQTLYYLYVTDRAGRLMGVMNMRDLLLASDREPVERLVRKDVATVGAATDREEVATIMRQRGFLALPVVDTEGRFLGVVKSDEALLAAQQEAFEDVQRMVGAGGDERASDPVNRVVRKRLPWLMVNLATAFLAAAVVSLFEDVIHRITALAVLLPIVAGQGGNTGAQTLAVVMRGIALREILPGSAARLVVKEALAGLANGLAVAAVTGAVVLLWDGRPMLAVVIGLSMIVNMVAAALAGAAIPLTLRVLGRDPAQSSSIFMTTVTDVVGFASFLGFALVFQSMLVAP